MAQNSEGDLPVLKLDLRHMTARQFISLGMSEVAYVKPVMHNGERAWAIHSADGTPMALAVDEALAIEAITEYEMLAARVH